MQPKSADYSCHGNMQNNGASPMSFHNEPQLVNKKIYII